MISKVRSLHVKTVLFQSIQFRISTQFTSKSSWYAVEQIYQTKENQSCRMWSCTFKIKFDMISLFTISEDGHFVCWLIPMPSHILHLWSVLCQNVNVSKKIAKENKKVNIFMIQAPPMINIKWPVAILTSLFGSG